MPRLTVIAVGDKLPKWADEACGEYLKRLPREFETALVAVKPEPRTSGRTAAQMMAAEAQRLRAALPRGARIVGLDEHGKDLTTPAFSAKVRTWLDSGVATAFLIGGPDGLDAGIKQECEMLLRLSSLTLPHALARAVFAEQLYRAASLLGGHPYHRE